MSGSGMAGVKLLVDVGNSRVKWAFGTADGFIAVGEARHNEAGGFRAMFDAGHSPGEIRVANVAGAKAGAGLAASLRERFGVTPVLARSAVSGAGVRNGYSDPAQLGVDRWLAICAAYARYRTRLCVVDAGTATTIDIVDSGGEHQGGLIMPGIALMQSALLGSTGDLARLAAESGSRTALPGAGPESPGLVMELGRDTAAAIRGAAVQATACLIWNCLGGARNKGSRSAVAEILVLTGGDAPLLGAAVRRMAAASGSDEARGIRLEHRPQLVLEGLALEPACFTVEA